MHDSAREVTIKARHNGPYLITGPVKLMDADGNQYYLQEGANVALCRCGGSSTKPFCDATHKKNEFDAPERALCALALRQAQGDSGVRDS